jgi:hypothetical protein
MAAGRGPTGVLLELPARVLVLLAWIEEVWVLDFVYVFNFFFPCMIFFSHFMLQYWAGVKAVTRQQ